MPSFRIDSGRSEVAVVARSSVHDTKTVFSGVAGTIDADPQTLADGSAAASLSVDMTTADAGDWLKNRKLRKDLPLAEHPTARFVLQSLTDVSREGDKFQATASGTLSWNGREIEVKARGDGTVTEELIEARARFDLDVRSLGVVPPKILMFKVEDVVEVDVAIFAARA